MQPKGKNFKHTTETTEAGYSRLYQERALFKTLVRKTKRGYARMLTEKIDESKPARQLSNLVKGVDTSLTGKPKKLVDLTDEEGHQFVELW